MPKLINILIEHMLPSDKPSDESFDFGGLENLLVQALFRHDGGWGVPPKAIYYILVLVV